MLLSLNLSIVTAHTPDRLYGWVLALRDQGVSLLDWGLFWDLFEREENFENAIDALNYVAIGFKFGQKIR